MSLATSTRAAYGRASRCPRASAMSSSSATTRVSEGTTRRCATAIAVTTVATALTRVSRAATIEAPRGYDAPSFASNGGANRFEASPASGSTSPRAYAIDWPRGWCALTDLQSARAVNVDASFKDPLDEASTLAVFVTRDVRERSVDERFGTLRDDARRRAESAARQRTIGARAGETRSASGRALRAHVIETEVGGGTAGRFGSAVELVKVFVDAETCTEYLVRATASKAAWPKVRNELRAAVESFEFVRE